jgi:PAS domain S-box-containing protein
MNPRRIVVYALALLGVAGAVALALAAELVGFNKLEVPLLLFAIAVAVWYGGFGPGVVAIVAAIASVDYVFTEPRFTFYIDRADVGYFIVFILFALLIGWFALRRRGIEQELRRARDELEARHANLLDVTHDAIFMRGMDESITYWNRGAQELFGWSAAQAVGSNAHELMRTVFPRPLDEIRDEFLRTGRWEGELGKTRADGRELVVASRWSLQRDAHQRPAAILETNNNVTERKAAEERIRKLNVDLERRTIELEASNKELEAFAYSVSHDLRAPLRHVAAYSELLQKQAAPVLDDRCKRYVANLVDSARKMGMLIDDLLAFSKIGRAETRMTLVSLDELAREVLRDVERDTDDRHIDWRISELPHVLGDRSMLRLALSNLVANAVKFTRPRPNARIEIGSRDASSDDLVVFVRDNGVGFDMKYVDKLFGVFQRLHSGETFEGTGIGLATVQRIIARHGGRAWAEGAVDGGATFYFSLPKP